MSDERILRRSQRLQLELEARCRMTGGRREHVTLSNISPEGCCIAIRGHAVQPGQAVVIQPASLEGIEGIVRWVGDNQAGVQFTRVLYAPVVEHLHRQHKVAMFIA